jgi:hypothetical protein
MDTCTTADHPFFVFGNEQTTPLAIHHSLEESICWQMAPWFQPVMSAQ